MVTKIIPEPTIKSLNRNSTIDFIRLIMAFGVVAIHVPFSTVVAKDFQDFFSPLCVPFFYVTSLTFFVSSLSRELLLKDVFRKKGMRVVLPYLGWSFVYVGLLILTDVISSGDRVLTFWRIFFYGESAVHLYFVPQRINMQLMVLGIYLIFLGKNRRWLLGLLLGAIAVGYLCVGYMNNCFGVTKPFHVLGYLVSAFLLSSKIRGSKIIWSFIIIGVFLVIIITINNIYRVDFVAFNLASLIPMGGIGLLLIAIGFPYLADSRYVHNIWNLS